MHKRAVLILVALWMIQLVVNYESQRYAPSIKWIPMLLEFSIGISGLLAIVINAGIMADEMEGKTIQFSMSRPIGRGQFLFGKFAGTFLFAVLFSLVADGTVYGLSRWMDPSFQSFSCFTRAFALNLVMIVVLSWFTLLMSVLFVNRLIAGMLSLAYFAGGPLLYSYLNEAPWHIRILKWADSLKYLYPFNDFFFRTVDTLFMPRQNLNDLLQGFLQAGLYAALFVILSVHCVKRRDLV